VVSLGFAADRKRIRKKVSGQTRTEVKDKLKALHSELDVGVQTVQGYTVESAVADWLAEGLPCRAAKTVEVYANALRPMLAVVGRIPLRDLTVQDVRTALAKMAVTHSTPTLQKAHNCLTRTLRHAEGRDLVRRNVSALVDTPRGREGRPVPCVHSLKLTDRVVLTGALSYLLMLDEGAAEQLVAASSKPVTPSGESPAGGVFRAGRGRSWPAWRPCFYATQVTGVALACYQRIRGAELGGHVAVAGQGDAGCGE